ncbi:alpha/beta fold hydrolase [Devosia sp.]|uniref:alpha/beta hydrolase n=1 Tax=Devosia sp. TaxID=1871048 RepID=UPI00326470BD
MSTLSGPMLAPLSGAEPKHLVVLLHGFGSDGADLIGLAPHFQPLLPDALFVAPDAPQTVPGYPSGFQWFALNYDSDRVANRQHGLPVARPVLVGFLNQLWEQTGLSAKDTVLIGFSQGAMMALHVGLSLPEALLGVVAFSGAFEPSANFGDVPKAPVCIVHGDQDQVVPAYLGDAAAAGLRAAGYDVRHYVARGVGHGISPDGLAFASDFVRDVASIA